MARESGNQKFEKKIIKKYPDLSPKFIFLYPAYNMRNNEISATIGISQLKRLDKNNFTRSKNLKIFLENIYIKLSLSRICISRVILTMLFLWF